MTSRCEVHQEVYRDQLGAMLEQEEKYYRCRDFLQLHGMEPIGHSPLHVVHACAMVVTDVPLVLSCSQDADTNHRLSSNNNLIRSPVLVSNFPSPTHSVSGFGDRNVDCGNLFPFSLVSSIDVPQKTPLCPTEAACLIEWRRQMLEWAYTLTTIYDLDREIVAVAFHMMDRYIASEVLSEDVQYAEAPLDREDIQLHAMVCMYITIKALVPYRKLTMDCIIEMSRGFYTEEHIAESELEILTALDWHVNQPTVMEYCRLFLKLFPYSWHNNEDEILASCQHLAEQSLYDVYFIPLPTSCVALAIVLLTSQRHQVSLPETEKFLENLQGRISLTTKEFDAVFHRLECLC